MNLDEKNDLQILHQSMKLSLIEAIKLLTNLVVLVSTGGLITVISRLGCGTSNSLYIYSILFFLFSIFCLFVATIINYLSVRNTKLTFDDDFKKYCDGKINKSEIEYFKKNAACSNQCLFVFWVLCLLSVLLGTVLASIALLINT